jgi:uncharacterized oxidoreductase
LRNSDIQIIELPPPRVATDMTGPADHAHTSSVDDFVAETMALLSECPDAGEVVVGAASAIRYAERDGTYARQFAAVNAS